MELTVAFGLRVDSDPVKKMHGFGPPTALARSGSNCFGFVDYCGVVVALPSSTLGSWSVWVARRGSSTCNLAEWMGY